MVIPRPIAPRLQVVRVYCGRATCSAWRPGPTLSTTSPRLLWCGLGFAGAILTFKMSLTAQQRKVVYWKAKMLGLSPLVCGAPPHCGILVLRESGAQLPAHPCHRVYGKCNFKKCIFEVFPRYAMCQGI